MAIVGEWSLFQSFWLPPGILLLVVAGLYLTIRYVQSLPQQTEFLPVAHVQNNDWKGAIYKATAQVCIITIF
jgi:hypothetical protein